MAKKKKSQRKRNFAYSSTGPLAAVPKIDTPQKGQEVVEKPQAKAVKMASGLDLRFVASDVRRLVILGGICIGIELLLWVLLHYSSLGQVIYGN